MALLEGPTIVGARERREIGKGVCTLHVARGGRKGRHFVLFRVSSAVRQIEILRLLHDAMDLKLHTSPHCDRSSPPRCGMNYPSRSVY